MDDLSERLPNRKHQIRSSDPRHLMTDSAAILTCHARPLGKNARLSYLLVPGAVSSTIFRNISSKAGSQSNKKYLYYHVFRFFVPTLALTAFNASQNLLL